MLSIVALAAVAAANPGVVVAQTAGCLEQVRAIYRTMMAGATAPGKAAHMVYSIATTAARGQRRGTTISRMDLVATRDRMQAVSAEMETYADATVQVLVLPKARRIIVRASTPTEFRQQRAAMLSAVRDTIFSFAEVTECAAVSEGGSTRRVAFRMRQPARDLVDIASFTVFMNDAQRTIQRISVNAAGRGEIQRLDVTFHTVEYDYPAPTGPVVGLVLDARGNPLPRYRGYVVTDMRGGGR